MDTRTDRIRPRYANTQELTSGGRLNFFSEEHCAHEYMQSLLESV